MFDVIVVGAGFSGAVMAERFAKVMGHKVLVVEQRNHIAGNCHDYYDESGVLVHKYGPHIFHTNKKRVWEYLSKFTKWREYQHEVLASIDDMLIPVPFNLNSLRLWYSSDDARKLEHKLVSRYNYGTKVPIMELLETDDEGLKQLANLIYEKVFVNYTSKQWGVAPDEISPEVTARVPVYISTDNRYFQDEYQALPLKGYTALFESLLANESITVQLSTNVMEQVRLDDKTGMVFYRGKPFEGQLVYTGMLDELFNYRFGELEYRSLQFEFENHLTDSYQESTTVNYPNDHDFTRITEFKKMTGQNTHSTTIVKEFPQDYDRHDPEKNVPYYPMMNNKNQKLYQQYFELSKRFESLTVLGRLGDFRYYNMDDAVERSLSSFEKYH